jgi:thioredoxin reductase (NADPH)
MPVYDVIVIGGGMAGLTAGLFSARHGRSTLVLEPLMPGGHLANVEKIEDFPGFPEAVAGYELGPSLQEQAANHGAAFQLGEADRLERTDEGWLVNTADGPLQARAVIVAAGSRPRVLGVPGEQRLYGRGVSQCASCDAPLLRGRPTAVVGGGDSALQEALTLANHASIVFLLHRRERFTAQQVYQQRVRETPKISVHFNTLVEELLGDDRLAAIRVRHAESGLEQQLEVAGFFAYVGLEPNTAFLQGHLGLDAAGRIPTDIWMRTALPGLLAAGDIRSDSAAQAISSAGDGATAAIAANRYLEDGSWPQA